MSLNTVGTSAQIGGAANPAGVISNNHKFTQRKLSQITEWVETHWPDLTVIENQIEII